MLPLLNEFQKSKISQASAIRGKREHVRLVKIGPRPKEGRFELPWELWFFIFVALDERSLMAFARSEHAAGSMALGMVLTGNYKTVPFTHSCRKSSGSNFIVGYGQFNL